MTSATGSYSSPIYNVSLLLKGDNESRIGINHLCAPEFVAFNDGIDVILGMDILQNCNMILDNSTGVTKLRIDYFN